MLNFNQLIEYFESLISYNYKSSSKINYQYQLEQKYNKYQIAYFNNIRSSYPNFDLDIEKTFL